MQPMLYVQQSDRPRAGRRAGLATIRVVAGAILAALLGSANAQDLRSDPGSVQLARYSVASAQPEPIRSQPMAVVATVHFPRSTVATVGDALRHLLVRTGYALLAEEQLEANARGLLSLPLPDSHRVLGPYRVDAMVQVLLGESWAMQVDHLQRQLNFAALGGQPGTAPATPAPTAALSAAVATQAASEKP